jgi:hypothetical protein
MKADDVGRFSKPSYVTALGATDTPNGWRQDKAKGGCLIAREVAESLTPFQRTNTAYARLTCWVA